MGFISWLITDRLVIETGLLRFRFGSEAVKNYDG